MNSDGRGQPGKKLRLRLEVRTAQLTRLADNRLLPAARLAGLVKPEATRESVCSDFFLRILGKNDSESVDVDWAPSGSAEAARSNLEFALFLIHLHNAEVEIRDFAEALGVLDRVHDECMYLLGFCDAVVVSRGLQTASAAKGRRAIGEQSREKVRAAARAYIGRNLSKERVAAELALKLHLDASTIRRKLSELFPGKAWEDGGINDSAR
jgi:hypothetical protein